MSESIEVLLLENIAPNAIKILKDSNFKITSLPTSLDKEELKKRISTVNIIGIRSRTIIDEDILACAPNLLCIGCYCIGTNQVDLEACKNAGVPVFNSPFQNSRSVAELIIAMVINLARRIGDTNSNMHNNIWNKTAESCYEIRGKTLGIVGFGHVGGQLGVLAEPMGMKVIYYDIINKMPLGNCLQARSLDEVLRKADFLTLHVPETEKTINLITSREIGLMKQGSYLLNASRGTVVVIDDLVQALKSNHLGGVYLDVYPEEPMKNSNCFNNYLELKSCHNVILTPHIGGSTQEAQDRIGLEVSEKLYNYIRCGNTLDSVNLPNVYIQMERPYHRILNIHKNIPGVLKTINGILSIYNIEGQILKTDSEIGYLLVDVNQGVVNEIVEKINKISSTIKTRILY